MSDANYPCAKCGERALGCHATCERYLAARAAADVLKALAYKDAEMPEGITSAAQAFFIRARTLYRSPVSADQGKREMKELEQQYIIDRGNEQMTLQYARLWSRIEGPAKTYSLAPSIENADLLYAAIYGLPQNWRVDRKVET